MAPVGSAAAPRVRGAAEGTGVNARKPATTDNARVRLLAMNLERWRWMPDDFGSRHIVVNLPAFHLAARENGCVLDMKVVVGEAEA